MLNNRYLVLSDMHFGTPESSVNNEIYFEALTSYIADQRHYDEIIFTGDLLDVYFSALTGAIEGKKKNASHGDLVGFRDFLKNLNNKTEPAGGLASLTDRWVYVPGNHDYKLWDSLAMDFICEDVLAKGDCLDPKKMPLQAHCWKGKEAFFSGIFQPFQVQDRVIVEYPNHVIGFDKNMTMVFTHGHYLDSVQTRGNDIGSLLGPHVLEEDLPNIRRRIFVETAQFQALATAVSFTEGTRSFFNILFGPNGIRNKLMTLGQWFAQIVFPSKGSLREKKISSDLLAKIEIYCERFCALSPIPKWFVFGHTHRQGQAKTTNHMIDVYNAGSCYIDQDMPITFIEVVVENNHPTVNLMKMDKTGTIQRVS